MIDAIEFRTFIRQNTPEKRDGDTKAIKRANEQYVQRRCLAHLIRQAFYIDSGLSTPERLRVARMLAAVEPQNKPQEWAEKFEAMAATEANTVIQMLWTLASDACALVGAPDVDEIATATDNEHDEAA